MTVKCSRCIRGRLFPENTADGHFYVCVNCGHRFSAVPLKALDIPAKELAPGGRKPKVAGQPL